MPGICTPKAGRRARAELLLCTKQELKPVPDSLSLRDLGNPIEGLCWLVRKQGGP